MPLWERLGGDAAIAAAVPDSYRVYREPITAALRYFVEHLPLWDALAIFAGQTALGEEASPSVRLAALAGECPVLHKIGQVLARDRRLEPGLRAQLQGLESMEPKEPVGAVRARIEAELGPLDALGLVLDPEPLAEASVAVVIGFTYTAESVAWPSTGRGVFKLLKPGVVDRLDNELALLEEVGSFLDERCAAFGIPALDYREVFQQVRERLGYEVRLDLEQNQLDAARRAYTGWESLVQIPRLLPWSTPRLTAMERVEGRKVTEPGTPSSLGGVGIAYRIVEALIAKPLWSTDEESVFHADPHAGNLFATDDGRLALLDWSLVGKLGRLEREVLSQVVLGALMLDPVPVREALTALSEKQVDAPALERLVNDHLGRVVRGRWPGVRWLTAMLDDAVQTAGLRVSADLLMFRRVLMTLEGVLSDVAGRGPDVEAILFASFLGRLASEWPGRAFAPPGSRAFGTRLANAELVAATLSLPWTATRVGLDWWRQRLARGREARKT